MSSHAAALLSAPRAALTRGTVDTPAPAADEVLVRVRAVAVNPVDWVIQGTSRITYRWLRTPAVLGSDVAGEVVAIGSGVTRFRVGQRVFGLATGTDRGRDPLREGAFQEYTTLLERLTAPHGQPLRRGGRRLPAGPVHGGVRAVPTPAPRTPDAE